MGIYFKTGTDEETSIIIPKKTEIYQNTGNGTSVYGNCRILYIDGSSPTYTNHNLSSWTNYCLVDSKFTTDLLDDETRPISINLKISFSHQTGSGRAKTYLYGIKMSVLDSVRNNYVLYNNQTATTGNIGGDGVLTLSLKSPEGWTIKKGCCLYFIYDSPVNNVEGEGVRVTYNATIEFGEFERKTVVAAPKLSLINVDKVYAGETLIYGKKIEENNIVKQLETSSYNGFWNTSNSGKSQESVVLSIEENGATIKGYVNNSWYFLCYTQKDSSGNYIVPTYDNQYQGYNDNGSTTNKYNIFWSTGANCWVWTDNTLDATNNGKFRYIVYDESLVETFKSTNLAGLIK